MVYISKKIYLYRCVYLSSYWFSYFSEQMIIWGQCCCLISNTSHEFCHLCYVHLVSLKQDHIILCHIIRLQNVLWISSAIFPQQRQLDDKVTDVGAGYICN